MEEIRLRSIARMGIINPSIFSGIARRLGESSQAVARSSERLASGTRITRASDDAAGLSIASTLRVRSRVFAQGIRNLNDGISALNVADGTLSNLSTIVTRLKELSEQAANGTYSRSQRVALDKEGAAFVEEFNRQIATASMNGLKLLDQSMRSFILQGGFGSSGSIESRLGTYLGHRNNDGTFSSATTVAAPAGGSSSGREVSADINNDGRSDIIYLSYTGTLTAMISNGDGTFTSSTIGSGYSSTAALGTDDLDGDGNADLAILDQSAGYLVITRKYGAGNGTFSTTGAQLSDDIGGSGGIMSIKFGDFNGDGVRDILYNYDNAGASQVTKTLLSSGTRSYSIASSGFADDEFQDVSGLVVGDTNNDGRDDFVIGGFTYLGQTNGTFSQLSSGSFSADIVILASSAM